MSMGTFEKYLQEKRDGKSAKDDGYTLKNWFGKDKEGWIQCGGKYHGKPCAKQPGQTTKPYCRDPDDCAKLSKEERNKRAAKKRKEDPNPNRKGKAKNVKQESYFNLQDLLNLDDSARLNKPGTTEGNWSWRLSIGESTLEEALKQYGDLAKVYNRREILIE